MNIEEVREQIQQDLLCFLDGIQSVLPEGSEDVIERVCEIVVENFAKLDPLITGMNEPVKLEHVTLRQSEKEGNAILLHPELFYRLTFNIKDSLESECADSVQLPTGTVIRALRETGIIIDHDNRNE
mgnify:FL=1|tara:strand:- start:191 stop:571 length:381 start_codon:yes stop_codon:yes gene_type:complete